MASLVLFVPPNVKLSQYQESIFVHQLLRALGPCLKSIQVVFTPTPRILRYHTFHQPLWNDSRQQWDACGIIDTVGPFGVPYAKNRCIFLVILSEDAYVSGRSFVFGAAKYMKGAVISMARLDRSFDNFQSLLFKETAHELGHVFGLVHCKAPCVMAFSPTADDVRLKKGGFCGRCNMLLKGQTVK
ncbi:hypothetical protein M427DRAFT_245294 [Gonapodya prolifera JEL478]|uniref:Peptidase zinc-dependent n=1 Tax=Gonapodya prolifera (strain JEL478) TaxID=1344416 RepID=A0A139ALW9_GONPJ|nr:hypothetical protein M427DRAFT_245294 [Gonapodya prolifera JEL478]|eukprot:KXS17760.1 hypothetical protein M427DRAFT_245294 [Gonapodya prolifera JEL478]